MVNTGSTVITFASIWLLCRNFVKNIANQRQIDWTGPWSWAHPLSQRLDDPTPTISKGLDLVFTWLRLE